MTSVKYPILEIPNLRKGKFLTRPNRFVAEIEYKGKIETAHVHDPGRLKELLIKGAEILFTNSKGKLKYYIKAVKCEKEWILIDSAQH